MALCGCGAFTLREGEVAESLDGLSGTVCEEARRHDPVEPAREDAAGVPSKPAKKPRTSNDKHPLTTGGKLRRAEEKKQAQAAGKQPKFSHHPLTTAEKVAKAKAHAEAKRNGQPPPESSSGSGSEDEEDEDEEDEEEGDSKKGDEERKGGKT